MFSKRIISMLVVLSFISQALVVVDTDSYSSAVVEDSSILEELYGENGARSGTVENYTLYKDVEMNPITFDYDGVDADWEIYPDLPTSLSFNLENGTTKTDSPLSTLSPGFFNHSTILPSVIVELKAGMNIS